MWVGGYTYPTTTNTPSVTTSSLANGVVGTPYSQQLSATNTNGPIAWSIETGALPAGLTLSASGLISGTPTAAASLTPTFEVTDSLNQEAFATLGITITAPAGGGPTGAPQAIWPGYKDSSAALVMAWPPLNQVVLNFTTAMAIGASTGILATPINPGTYAFTWTGTPGSFGPEYHNVLVAADGVTCTLKTNGNIAHAQTSGPGGVAQVKYDAVDSYNYYRSTDQITWVKANSVPILNSPNVSLSSLLQPWYCEPTGTLAPNTKYFYRATAVLNGIESAPSPVIAITTRDAQVGAHPPNPPTDPATWIKANVAPNITIPPPVTTQAQFVAALAAANINGPNIIVLAANTTFAATSITGWTLPAFTGTGGPTWIVSSQAPEINASGTLIPFRSDFPLPVDVPFALTAAPAAAATSATLTAPWPGKDGAYWTIFTETATGYEEQRLVLFANGQVAISWPANLNGSPPLLNACNATIRVGILAGVTPCPTDLNAMATLQMGAAANSVGVAIPAGCKNVRFVGIRIIPAPGAPQATFAVSFPLNPFNVAPVVNPDHVYFDRCMIGMSTADPSYTYLAHGLSLNADHFFCNQTYIQGVVAFQQAQAGDSNGFFCLGGGQHCWQNTYFEGGSEGGIYGGGAVYPQTNIPHDIVMRGCFHIKPLMWQSMHPPSGGVAWVPTNGNFNIGDGVKNHQEFKTGIRVELFNTAFWNSWTSLAAGQASALNQGPLEQASTGQFPITQACPWSACTDVNIHDIVEVNLQRGMQCHAGDVCATGINERLRIYNTLTYINPLYGDTKPDKYNFWGITTNSVPDLTVDHNVFVINTTNPLNASPASTVSLYNTAANIAFTPTYTPNPKPAWCDGASITNNVLGGSQAMLVQSRQGAAAYPFFVNTATSIMTNNVIAVDTQPYPAGNFASPPVPYASLGFANWNPNSISQTWGAPRPAAGDWIITSGTYATASTTGGPVGLLASFAITTTTLPDASVGASYHATVTATGGSGSYAFALEGVAPHKHFWLKMARNGQLYGTPQWDSIAQGNVPESFTVVCTDTANGTSVTANLTINIAASGALASTVPATLPNATQNGGYAYQLLASGGVPPYTWKKVSSTGSNTWNVTPAGWLNGVPTANTADTVTIGLTDSAGATVANFTVNLTTNATIQLACIDLVTTYPGASLAGVVKLPGARVGHKYSHQLFPANGGSGGTQTYTILNGTLPAGLSMSAAGLITGTPTQAGNASCSLQVTDGVNTTSAYPLELNVARTNKGTKPTANTATGVFFFDTQGFLCDPNSFRFTPVGYNRVHYDQTFSGYKTAGVNAVRYNMFTMAFRGGNPGGAQTMATYCADAVAQHTNNQEFVIFTNFYNPGTSTDLTGDTTVSNIGRVAAMWCDNVLAFNTSSLSNNCAICLQNEWGPANQNFQFAEAVAWDGPVGTGVWQMPVSTVSGSTITLTSTALTHPLTNQAANGWVYFAGGNITKAIQISGIGGSSGAWTITAQNLSDVSGWTSGGTISAGAIGMIRAAGIIAPILIDAGAQFGQHINTFLQYGPAIALSDPFLNTGLSIHAYSNFVNYGARISAISKAANALITLNDAATFHPFNPAVPGGSSGYSNVNPNTNTFSITNQYFASGVAGMTQINGSVPAGNNSTTGGPQPTPFTVLTSLNTSGSGFGAYTGGGWLEVDANISSSGAGINRTGAALAALRSQGIFCLFEEYGPQTSTGPTPLLMDSFDVIMAAAPNGLGDLAWALDGGPPFNAVANQTGTYTVPTQLTASGIDQILNPRYGIHCRAAPAPKYL